MPITVERILRYPVKGLSPEELDGVALTAGEGLPCDRRFAIAHGASAFDPDNPTWVPRREFLVLAHEPRLAALRTTFDDRTGVSTIGLGGAAVARADITTEDGRAEIDRFLAGFMADDGRGKPRIVHAPGVMLTDSNQKWISIINLASVRELERAMGQSVDPRRFRGNLLIDGADPWQEFGWVGKHLWVGEARLRVVERIERCAATNVNPDTAERDMMIPKALRKAFGHLDCGVLAEVVQGGCVKVGDVCTEGMSTARTADQ
jgi:uncharacterized protein YcbX